MKSSPRHRLTATTTAVVFCAGAALIPGTVAASTRSGSAGPVSPDHRHGCLTLDVVDRSINEYSPPQSPKGPIGAFATYNGLVSDGDDSKVIGTEVGSVNVLYVRAADHHLIESRAELWQLPEGTISYLGLEDRTAMAASQPLHSRVHGTSGAYAGKVGWMDWTVHGDSIQNNWTAEHFVLCGE